MENLIQYCCDFGNSGGVSKNPKVSDGHLLASKKMK